MADLRPKYSEEVVGHGHPTKDDVANRAWNVEHAEDGTHKILPGASGIKLWFYQNVAPTGWTLDATPSDDLLAVKGGAQAYNANGGTGAGTWTVAGLTKDAHTHAFTQPDGHSNHTALALNGVGTHTHTGPSHYHTLEVIATVGSKGEGAAVGNIPGDGGLHVQAAGGANFFERSMQTDLQGTGATGNGGDHNHTFSQNITAHSAHANGAVNAQSDAGISSTGNWRPKARLGIICTKD